MSDADFDSADSDIMVNYFTDRENVFYRLVEESNKDLLIFAKPQVGLNALRSYMCG